MLYQHTQYSTLLLVQSWFFPIYEIAQSICKGEALWEIYYRKDGLMQPADENNASCQGFTHLFVTLTTGWGGKTSILFCFAQFEQN